jgi:PAS domain S-box-containing protein
MNKPTKILITEDEMIVALDLEMRLKKMGYECLRASTGELAVSIAAEEAPDIVLMDICLPGEIDGIAAAERLKLTHNIPIIYLTANADEHTLQRAQVTHPASYLLKPFKERELQICIEMALINHALQTELRTARSEMEKRVIERTAELLRTNEALRKEMKSRQESELQVREQAALIDKSRDAIYVQDLDGHLLFWNSSAERLYGYPRAEALGQVACTLLHSNAGTIAKALEVTQRDGEWMGELVHRQQSGAERIVESRWTFMPDKGAVLVVETDISERKKVEAQFLRAQRLESVGALASGIAHDLNNVFTPLLMTAQMLREELTDPKFAPLVDIIMSSAVHGSDMVKQVLLFVRGVEGETIPFRIEHLVKELVNLLRETFPKNIRIRSSFAPELDSMIGDATRLHQVLMNLCVNARDAMPNGGELGIAMNNFSADEPFASTHREAKPGDYVRITVSDTGTGMSPEVVNRIFEPFFTTKAPGKGTGLGLATVQTIVQAHGGFLEVESKPGSGTKFHVCIPAEKETIGRTVEPAMQVPRGHNELIMIADDERAVREIVKATLEACGYRTLTADNGIDAVSKFALQRDEIAGVITDLQMPHLDGMACAQALRQINSRTPVLIVSGADISTVPLLQIEALGASFLAKPFSKMDLLKALHRCLTKAQTDEEIRI